MILSYSLNDVNVRSIDKFSNLELFFLFLIFCLLGSSHVSIPVLSPFMEYCNELLEFMELLFHAPHSQYFSICRGC